MRYFLDIVDILCNVVDLTVSEVVAIWIVQNLNLNYEQ